MSLESGLWRVRVQAWRTRKASQKKSGSRTTSGSSSPVLRLSHCLLFAATVLATLGLSSCGYHVAGTSARLPPGIRVIAVPTLENKTTEYRVEQRLTEAVIREFITRTRYRVVPVEADSDAVLHGEISSFETSPIVFDTTIDPNTAGTNARATTMLVSVRLKIWLEERETKKVLFRDDNFLFREPYEISTDAKTFFDERGPAVERLAREFASRLVADVMENF